jgi:predicted RNA-binding Zn ribbon-like protein
MLRLLVLIAVLAAAVIAAAQDTVRLVADGHAVRPDAPPVLRDGHVYVPLRAAAEAVHGEVSYDPDTKRVQVCKGPICTFVSQGDALTLNGRLFVGVRELAGSLQCTVTWDHRAKTVTISSGPATSTAKLVANGRDVKPDPPPMLRGGHVYVPLRAAAKAVGGEVTYYPDTRQVRICTSDLCTFVEQSDGLTVNRRLFVGIRKLAQALQCKVDWDNRKKAVIITSAPPTLH